jgi:ABC-type anion transport system duplicated permease subunit
MTNLTSYPLQDGFETTLAQSWNGSTGTVYLTTSPSFTFPSGVTTYIVVDPGKTNMQVAKIDSLNVGAKTVNVSSVTVNK